MQLFSRSLKENKKRVISQRTLQVDGQRHGKKVNKGKNNWRSSQHKSSRRMCKEKHDTWIVSQIRELSEMFELVVSAVKDKPEQMV